METLCLLDATVTQANMVKLRFLNVKGEVEEFTDEKYRPYFLVPYPLTVEDAATVKYFSGEAQEVEKIDLFSGGKRVFGKIYWPNHAIALKAAERFQQCWESEIDYARSYVYDKGLIFGALHSRDALKPILDVPAEVQDRFTRDFGGIERSDPLKYAQIAYWFSLLHQPIPRLNSVFLAGEKADEERVHVAWMLSRIANIPLHEAYSSKHVSDWLRSIIYTHLRKNNILVPTTEELKKGKETHTVTGALTVSPKPGVYFGTVVCDFESLYPSCIDSFNLSYETVECPHLECQTNRIPDFEYNVCAKRRGFYSILIGALKELRIRLFKPLSKDRSLPEEERQKATAAAKLLKLISVSSYGVTVRIRGLACPPLAEAITGYGRYALRESWKLAEEKGLRPLYGDTDSLFLDNATDEQIEWLIKTVREKFKLDLAVEKRYSLCVLPKAKKAYFGILSDGTPDLKGLTAIKSNAPRYITKLFQQCIKELSAVRNQTEYEQAKERIKEIVCHAITELKARHVALEDLTYSVKLYFDPSEKASSMKTTAQPYQCALQLLDAGKKLKRGETVSFVKVKTFKYNGRTFTVKPAELLHNMAEINIEDYVRNLLTALNQTFEPMNIKLETEKEAGISRWLTSE